MVTFSVFGKVRGQARPRFTGKKRRKGGKTAYETPEDTAYKKAIAKAYRKAAKGDFIGSGEVGLHIDVFRIMPKGYSGDSESDTYRPDVDNIAKAVMDALNGVAYADDKQVTYLCIEKHKRVKKRKRECIHVTVWRR